MVFAGKKMLCGFLANRFLSSELILHHHTLNIG